MGNTFNIKNENNIYDNLNKTVIRVDDTEDEVRISDCSGLEKRFRRKSKVFNVSPVEDIYINNKN